MRHVLARKVLRALHRRSPLTRLAYVHTQMQAFDKYKELELRQTELEEQIEHGEGDVAAAERELQNVQDEMDRLEQEMGSDDGSD